MTERQTQRRTDEWRTDRRMEGNVQMGVVSASVARHVCLNLIITKHLVLTGWEKTPTRCERDKLCHAVYQGWLLNCIVLFLLISASLLCLIFLFLWVHLVCVYLFMRVHIFLLLLRVWVVCLFLQVHMIWNRENWWEKNNWTAQIAFRTRKQTDLLHLTPMSIVAETQRELISTRLLFALEQKTHPVGEIVVEWDCRDRNTGEQDDIRQGETTDLDSRFCLVAESTASEGREIFPANRVNCQQETKTTPSVLSQRQQKLMVLARNRMVL